MKQKWIAVISLSIIVIATGSYWFLYAHRNDTTGRPVPAPDFDLASPVTGDTPHPGDQLITIQQDKLANAHFKIEGAVVTPNSTITTSGLRTTGIVEPNAYRVVPVIPIAGGIVRQVNVELGDKVKRGQKLATIFSTELSEAQSFYLSMQAEIERHHNRYNRSKKLLDSGLTSRQDFELVSAEYKIEQAKVSAARQKLLLLGMTIEQVDNLQHAISKEQVNSMISLEAPSSGIILNRSVNAGEVIPMGKELFRIADLSAVWIIGQIYEKDFSAVRIGTSAVITSQAYPEKSFTGRVSYIDPRVNAETRTAQIRIEVNNLNNMLKLGMFVDVIFGASTEFNQQSIVQVPRNAVQIIGSKHVVFVVTDKSGVFAQREVSAGAESNDMITINNGLNAGEKVVTEGSFLLRAESLKLNPGQLKKY